MVMLQTHYEGFALINKKAAPSGAAFLFAGGTTVRVKVLRVY